MNKTMSNAANAAWPRLEQRFRDFYDSLHEEWYYLASRAMGPSPTKDWFILGDLEWGILDDIGDPGCDLKDLVAVYSNGLGAYIARSIEHKAGCGDVLWFKDKPPRLNIDFWDVTDAWTDLNSSSQYRKCLMPRPF